MLKKKWIKILLIIIATIILIVGIIAGIYIIDKYLNRRQNVIVDKKHPYSLYIRENTDFDTIMNVLINDSVFAHPDKFKKYAIKKNYPANIHKGHYVLENGMSNERVLTILSLALQTPVNVVINPARDAYTIASRVGKQLEADSAALIAKYFDTAFIKSLGYDTTNAYCLIIPNTYEFYWTTDASQFWERMRTESDKFWKKREQKFDDVKLTKEEVVTLASIVERETQKNDEKKLIAGVYMNRLQKRMRLEADPTLVYIANQENIRRVLNRHKNIDSPYNTYKYAGLPPGPIWIPSVASIDAVLDYEDHEYLFFCAKDDFSGCHAFAKSYAQHKVNAKKFQKALNDRQIYK